MNIFLFCVLFGYKNKNGAFCLIFFFFLLILKIGMNYILILKTISGDPDGNLTVRIKGSRGESEKLSLGKSQVVTNIDEEKFDLLIRI